MMKVACNMRQVTGKQVVVIKKGRHDAVAVIPMHQVML